jgi:hypothetical protein
MDILYYSNYCKHSQKVIQILSKGSITDKISFICIDKRTRDPKTNQQFILLENGTKVVMPPNLHSVPALLLVNQNYRFILGDEIVKHYHADILEKKNIATHYNGEPVGFPLGNFSSGSSSNIVSEQYTMYNMTPDELSAKGNGKNRPLHNYVSASDDVFTINTPPDSYRPDKISNDVTIDNLQQKRLDDINHIRPNQQPFAAHI